ncbi:minor capsid protein [Myroides sp. LJL115]
MDVVTGVYKAKGVEKDYISKPVVQAQGKEFSKAIDTEFGQIDFNSPDYVLRETLKKNTWDFSIAKNYNDNIKLNNLLLNSDGSLRSWNDFKHEAQKVVGDSIKYLKTEYDTIVASAQMSRIWQDLQRTKDIFPFVQMIVVKDGRTSDTCESLADVIFNVDDPSLMYYWPPNHFNCRTTIKKLRYGVPTAKYDLPDIPEEFRNNVGVTGQVFTAENSYISNTPKEVLLLSDSFYKAQNEYDKYNTPEYYDVELSTSNGVKAIHKGHTFDPRTGHYEKEIQNILYEKGNRIILTDESSDVPGKKVDGILNEQTFDISSILGEGKNTIKRAFQHSEAKKAEVAIIHFPITSNYSKSRVIQGIRMYQGQTKYRFKAIIIVVDGNYFYI